MNNSIVTDDLAIDDSKRLDISETFRPHTHERNILHVAKGGGIIFGGKLYTNAIRFVIAFLLARFLGAEQYGLYSVAISASAVAAALALLGLDSALVRFVAISASRRDEAGLWGALQIGLGLATLGSVAIGVSLYAVAYPIAEHVFHKPELAPLLQFISVIVPPLTLSDLLAGANRGFKKMQYPVIAQLIVQPTIRLILTVGLALAGLNATRAIVIYGLTDGVAGVMMLYFLHKQFSLKRPLSAARRDVGAVLSYSVPAWLSQLVTKFHGNVQTLLLGAMSTITEAGIFAVAGQLNMIGGEILASATTSARPLVAELHDRGDREQLGRLYQTVTYWSLALNLPIFLATILFAAPILSIFGESFVAGAAALSLLACANLANTSTGMCGAVLDMTGHVKFKLVNSIIRVVLTLGLNLVLIPRWGMMGAAVTALVGEGAINLLRVLEVLILLRLWPYNRNFIKLLIAGIAALVSAWAIGQWLPAEVNFLYLAANIVVILVVYVATILLIGLSAEDRLLVARMHNWAAARFARRH